jgi:hypothetical protein
VSAAETTSSFAAARAAFEQVIAFTRQAAVDEITHGQLERELATRMREVTRVLFQDHLDLREVREARAGVPVADAEGISRNRIERHRRTGLDTVFGPVAVHRIAYRGDYVHDLHLLDASLNLPEVKASHGLARRAVLEAVRGSFAAATEQLRTTCGVRIGSRQVQDLVVHAACDIEDFYAAASPVPAGPGTLLVLTFDGKGIVMRPDALREATAKAAAAKGANTYKTRLASGEKNGRKRMAEIAAVYDADPAVRTAADILPEGGENEPAPGAVAFNKWLSGSVEHPAAETIKAAFNQAKARDPHHTRPWIVLVDGAAHQIELVKTEAKRRRTPVTIIVDFIHVIEYLWKAAWCLYKNGDPEAEAFVAAYGREILAGGALAAAAQLERAAHEAGLEPGRCNGIDDAIGYLAGKAPYLAYDKALAHGWPIATGVIEGACRHLIKDRLDITGARWSVDGAEAVLRLRALRSSGDFEAYWAYHEARDYQRNHLARYKNQILPTTADP